MESILTDQKERERVSSMARIFTKVDRVLSGDPVEVEVEKMGPYMPPSYTDGKTISFNVDRIGDITSVEDLVSILGLNYHELAHVLYTPRGNSEVIKRIISSNLHDAFNILEDQRIETFLTSTYPSTIPYLTSTLLRYCTETDISWETNHILVHGRRYIPADIRREFRNRFSAPHLASRAESIIDEYRKIVFPRDADRAYELVEQFKAIICALISRPADPHDHKNKYRPEMKKGRVSSQRDQSKASEASDRMDQDLEESSSEEGPSEGQGDDTGKVQSRPSGSGESGESSGDGQDWQPSLDQENNSQMSNDNFRDAMRDLINDAETDQSVMDDVAMKQRAIVHGGEIDLDLPTRRYAESPVRAEDIDGARQFAGIIDQLRSDADPGWLRYAPSGKVNIQRVMRGDSYDRVWDKWAEGNDDASDIECVINIDTSISMKYQIVEASRAMWVIKKALESIDASVTVLGYNDYTFLVYGKNERVNTSTYRSMRSANGTAPRKAIEESVRVLESSRRKNKIFISITDGQWPYENNNKGPTSEEMIAALSKRGVTTALAFIGSVPIGREREYVDDHNCQIVSAVNDPRELVRFAREIVSYSMRRKDYR